MSIESATGFVGGLGLFLVGMWLMTEGLKVAAGPSLKTLLERWTNSRVKGLASGFALTALVQSSSAVTVAVIGFVNAGILTLGQAVWVVFGSNVGTTMTGWIVATVGFNVNVEFLALPMIGVGMIVRLTAPGAARGALGEALTGFGLFFLGVAVLQETFEGIAAGVHIETFAGGFFQDALFVLIGFAITALAQSSSASIAVALSAVSGGLIGMETGAAMVIGANLGTTVTGVLAVLNATSNARRVAAGHVIFNLATGLVAFLILPAFVAAANWATSAGWISPGPAVTLALFHTLFNISGVVLIWFQADRLIAWLETLFVSEEENEARPRHLDRTLREMPSIAAPSLLLELKRLGEIATGTAAQFLLNPVQQTAHLRRRSLVFSQLAEAIRGYAAVMSEARLPAGLPDALAHILRALQHYNALVHELQGLAVYAPIEVHLPEKARESMQGYRLALATFLTDPQVQADKVDGEKLTAMGQQFETQYQTIKQEILTAASRGDFVHLAYLDDAMREADLLRRIAHHTVRSAMRLHAAQNIVTAPAALEEGASAEVMRNE